MKQSYKVVITKEHCADTDFADCKNCAVTKALKETFPELKHVNVNNNPNGTYIDNIFFRGDKVFGCDEFEKVLYGEIESFEITYTNTNAAPEVKERIVYVSVPESIVNQSKELILQ